MSRAMTSGDDRDEADRRALFDRVWELLLEAGKRDATLSQFDRRPTMFSLNRHGHLLTYALGDGQKIAVGEIQWGSGTPKRDGDLPHRFRVERSPVNDDRFRIIVQGVSTDDLDLDAVAKRIVDTEYLGTTS